jgi:acyl carrier protein
MQIREELKQFVIDNFMFGQDGALKEDDSFLEKGIMDSTGLLELIAFLETTYRIKISDDELVPGNLDSIGNITGYLKSKGVFGGVQEHATGR